MFFSYNKAMSELRTSIYYEFKKVGNDIDVKQTGTRTIGPVSITTGIDTVPTMSLTIPLEDIPDTELARIEAGQVVEPHLQRYNITVYIIAFPLLCRIKLPVCVNGLCQLIM